MIKIDTVKDRPGIIEAFMIPVKLKNQVRTNAAATSLEFEPAGKTTVGTTQWMFQVQRPGIAEPLIVAKKLETIAKADAAKAKA